MERALNIPEILGYITQYFVRRELVKCLLVNKVWHRAFLRQVWLDIRVSAFMRSPTAEHLQANAHLVRALTYDGFKSEKHFQLDRCTSLNCLTVESMANATANTHHWAMVATLVRQNLASLKSIHVGTRNYSLSPEMWQVLAGVDSEVPPMEADWSLDGLWGMFSPKMLLTPAYPFVQLQKLVFTDASFMEADIIPLWRAFKRIQALELAGVRFYPLSDRESMRLASEEFMEMTKKAPALANIKDLRVVDIKEWNSDTVFMMLVAQCPNVQRLCWYSQAGHVTANKALRQVASGPCWNQLESLELFATHPVQDNLITTILDSIPAGILRELVVPCSYFDASSFRALRKHCELLQVLKLSGAKNVTSTMIQQLLESCPSLQHLWAPRLSTEDVARGLPWVSLKLRKMMVGMHAAVDMNTITIMRMRLDSLKCLSHQDREALFRAATDVPPPPPEPVKPAKTRFFGRG